MASCNRKGRPHFFKIILDNPITERKLGIPGKFAQMYGDFLTSPVILKVPSGSKWKVEIVKSDGKIWLENGWKDFVEYYSLVHGSFLVFEYEQCNSTFNVIIFDRTATEIDYPFNFIHGGIEKPDLDEQVRRQDVQEEEEEEEEAESDVSLEILGDISTSRKAEGKLPLQSSQPYKKMKLENSPGSKVKLEAGSDFKAKEFNGGLPCQKQSLDTWTRTLTNLEKANALQRASANFKSENPFFMIVMQPSYVSRRGSDVVIPLQFAIKYLNMNGGDAILSVSDGRTWSVKYCIRTSSGAARSKITSRSWIQFAGDNRLQVGDVCVFELIDLRNSIFRVAISRETKCSLRGNNSKQSMDKGRSSKKPSFSNLPEAVEAGKKFTSVNPFFEVVMTPSYLEGGPLSIPQHFVKNIKHQTENVKLKFNNRWWPVKLINNQDYGKGSFSGGWAAFARESSLKVGDVCIFELINNEIMLINVSIHRKNSSN